MRRGAPREGKRVGSRSTTSDQSQREHHEPELLKVLGARAVGKSCEPETGEIQEQELYQGTGTCGQEWLPQ